MYGMFLCAGACAALDAAASKCIRSIAWLGQMHLVVDGSVECAAAAAERACVCGLVRLVRSDSVARLRDVRHVLVWGGLCLRWSLVFALVFAVFALVFGLCAGLCGLCAGLCGCLGWPPGCLEST